MSDEEAINILIANAVCSSHELHCDIDCPFYMKCETLNFKTELPKAVNRLNRR